MQQMFAPPAKILRTRRQSPIWMRGCATFGCVRGQRITGWTGAALALALLALGCGGSGARPDGGDDGMVSYVCPPPAPTSCPNPSPRYADIAPIIAARCQTCHSGLLPDVWPLNDYQHVADWQDIIRDALLACTMPPADAGFQISTAESVAVLTWIRCGFPP